MRKPRKPGRMIFFSFEVEFYYVVKASLKLVVS